MIWKLEEKHILFVETSAEKDVNKYQQGHKWFPQILENEKMGVGGGAN